MYTDGCACIAWCSSSQDSKQLTSCVRCVKGANSAPMPAICCAEPLIDSCRVSSPVSVERPTGMREELHTDRRRRLPARLGSTTGASGASGCAGIIRSRDKCWSTFNLATCRKGITRRCGHGDVGVRSRNGGGTVEHSMPHLPPQPYLGRQRRAEAQPEARNVRGQLRLCGWIGSEEIFEVIAMASRPTTQITRQQRWHTRV